ncbi:MAG: hypothetical protein EOO75_00655 [Myxococcales bacterium]|nr:MAG: hypothetical protein EOO75_00655 [Myxococcales bacterium]
MKIHRFSSVVRGLLAVGVMGLSGLALGGCGDDDPACDGVLRDGTCYVTCDEAIDCPGSKCVAYTDPADGIAHTEGKCFSPCTEALACGPGQACVSQTSLKGEAVTVCQSRPVAGLPPGKAGDGCTENYTCDEGSGLTCLEGVCGLPPAEQGGACVDRTCAEGLVCFQDRCQTASGAKGEACGEGRGCADPLVCLEGTCQTSTAGPGEACDASRLCNPTDGLACSDDGRCLYGCSSLTPGSCGEGYTCRALAAADNGFSGVCRPSDNPADHGPGQFGTACPKGTECAAGFTCVPGENPASNYCSKTDGCEADDQCPGGYWCGSLTRLTADKKEIDFANPNRLCLQRDFCAPCSTDLDCSWTSGAICVPDADGEKFCSLPCNSAKNSCVIGAACVEVEQRNGVPVTACRPDVGVCHAKGAPTGCEPCRIDGDCGDNALCADGAQGNKPSLRWCETPCGPADADGKHPCPIAPNGIEMVCLDETLYTLGGPIKEGDTPLYGTCFRPYTVDNTVVGTKDPANHVCGDGKREAAEECDDGNSSATDGCDACKITAKCRFTLGPVVGPGQPSTLLQGATTLTEIPSSCPSFRVEGTIAKAGDVAEFRFPLVDGAYSWFSVSTGAPDSCTTDLVATVQTGDYDVATDKLDITNKDGAITPCDGLTTAVKNLDAAKPSLCPDNQSLGCGSCSDKGLCGTCDDDSGIGNCPRMLLTNTTVYQNFKVKFASVKQQARIYARDGKSTNVPFVAIADRLANGSQGPKFTPTLSCY